MVVTIAESRFPRTHGGLKLCSIGVALLAIASASPPTSVHASDPQRPNIVFIFSRRSRLSGHRRLWRRRQLIETPNIDRIAKRGHAVRPLPGDQLDLRPQPGHDAHREIQPLNGFYNNTNSQFDGSQATFPKLLQAAGYQTAIFGKWHLVTDPTGFDYWHILPGQGVYYNPPMIDNGKRVKHEGYATDSSPTSRSTGSRSATGRSRSC